ncbi:DUF916 and DUF3324 domain-containing protein [Carnobacterium maltaromaticum]|uniref:DUF916 and DUF3324 domain-containing protein n=1 Tax=Carnobacterium maltaromaticum TaxID=2751 RepID=UPI00298A2688|nr:DUF916 and DUF3324 domain-containing protein [Carnobacterium maltaromaticum]MDW5523888.1 DUF916 and DUF3324 domain-containing protein [Carnobacterium maltaromaticum]
MKKNGYIFILTLLSGILLFMGTNTVHAADMTYSVKTIIPENQIDKDKTYFDLKMVPGQKQMISLELENSSDQEITIQIGINTATTNRNGVINYGDSNMAKDSSLTYDISELIQGENEIVLLPKEKKVVNYTVTMPEKSFDGILLGGFYIHKKLTKEEQESEKNVQIKNDYSYIVGIKLTETDVKVEPELKLNDITPGLQNYRTVVNATLQNITPTIISGMSIEASIRKKGSDEIIHQAEKSNQSMAPNSSYQFPISWDNQELKPGKYNLGLKAIDGNNNEWQFSKEFEITSDVKELNEEAIELEEKDTFQIYLLALVILLILLSICYLIFKKKKKKKKRIKRRNK